jgi:hypothetical protein
MQIALAVLIVVTSVAPGVVATLILTTQNVTNPTSRWLLLVMTVAGPVVDVIVFAVGLIVAALRSPKAHEPLDPESPYPPG